jgi:AcrR family transcriptional regulator
MSAEDSDRDRPPELRPGGRKTRQEVLRDFRREQILDAALQVIGGMGFAEASIERIAEAAGVARSTVYVYFQGKEEILNECLAIHRIGLGERVRAAVDAADGLEDRLAAYVRATLEYVDRIREFFVAVMAIRGIGSLMAAPGPDGGPAAELDTIRNEVQGIMAGLLKEGQLIGEIPEDRLAEAADVFGTLLYGALMRRSQFEDPPAAQEDAERLARVLLYGLSGPR